MADSPHHREGGSCSGANPSITPSRFSRRWGWAYRKIRSLQCGRLTAAWRATRFALFGNSGRFFSRHGWTKLRLSDD